IGSSSKLALRNARGGGSEQEKDAAAGDVEGQDATQQMDTRQEPVEPDARQRCPQQGEEQRRRHGTRLGIPMTMSARITAIEPASTSSIARMMSLAHATGIARNVPARAPRTPTSRKKAGPATAAVRSVGLVTRGGSASPARNARSSTAAITVPPWNAPPGALLPTQTRYTPTMK